MPRRDALSEKKRERLMQEHEHLQKLMLQARSSVRRSSLKNDADTNSEQSPEVHTTTPENLEEQANTSPVSEGQNLDETSSTKKRLPLTEKELFPEHITTQESNTRKPPLTEKDLFPNSSIEEESERATQKATVVKVIWPDQNVAASIAQRNIAIEENNMVNHSVGSTKPAMPSYTQVQEEDAATYHEDNIEEKRPRQKAGRYAVLAVIVLLVGFGGYYLYRYQSNQENTVSVAKQNTPIQTKTSVPRPVAVEVGDTERLSNTTNTGTPNKKQAASNTKQNPATTPAQNKEPSQTPADSEDLSAMLKHFDNVTIVNKSATQTQEAAPSNAKGDNQAAAATSLGKYKVVSKAYFHDAPDESTRRKAFIIHWNNAVLTPLEEKNGFVYVVFTNHLGQTSKGWLRKEDLQRIE